ncbi:MAG: GntR family transcriptional regulator [Victivallales bacterium]
MANIINNTSPMPKYYQVMELLKKEIDSGKFKRGQALPSNPQLMQKYAVSQNTVRQAIASLVHKGLVYTDHGRGTFVSELNNSGRSRTKTSALIGLLVPSIDRPFIYSGVALAIEAEAHARGYNVLLGNFHHDFVMMKKYIASFVAQNVAGIVLVPCMAKGGDAEYEKKNATLVRLLEKSSIPFVFFDGYLETMKTDCVAMNNEKAGFIATEHLIKQGYKRIAFLKCSYITSVKDRINGYKKALKHYGFKVDEKLIVKNTISGINTLLNADSKVDGIVCVHDGAAVKVLDILRKRKLEAPASIGVVGFDDNAAFLNASMPLTSIRQPLHEIGQQAINLLFDKIEGKTAKAGKIIFTEPELVVRASSLRTLKAKKRKIQNMEVCHV